MRREADKRKRRHDEAESAVERMNAQVLIDWLARTLAYETESGKGERVEHEAGGAERRQHEQKHGVDEPRRVDVLEEQLHVCRRQAQRNINITRISIHVLPTHTHTRVGSQVKLK